MARPATSKLSVQRPRPGPGGAGAAPGGRTARGGRRSGAEPREEGGSAKAELPAAPLHPPALTPSPRCSRPTPSPGTTSASRGILATRRGERARRVEPPAPVSARTRRPGQCAHCPGGRAVTSTGISRLPCGRGDRKWTPCKAVSRFGFQCCTDVPIPTSN
ncbi:uncharacterized protein LOC135174706 [Pogoniulus pusillus]|uniref:uncharacterized protein LOC135174706 n=1 Tax=Pogoniulus pusillus TaxID=488313 RepID=UPI0030B9670F